jgi:DNA polymerase III subunit beta
MQINLTRNTVLSVLKRAAASVSRHSNVPLLNHLLMKGEGDTLTFTGSDLQSQVTVTTKVSPLPSPVSVLLSAKKLTEIVTALDTGEDIVIELKEDQATIRSGRSFFRLKTLDAIDYPLMPGLDADSQRFEFSQAKLREMITLVTHASAVNDVRQFLNGVFFSTKDGVLDVVATNGHRLATTNGTIDFSGDLSFILPNKTVDELLRSLDEDGDQTVEFAVAKNMVQFDLGTTSIVSKLVDGMYPNWRRVVPASGKSPITLPVPEVKASLTRSKIAVADGATGAKIKFDAGVMKIDVVSHAKDKDSCDEEIEVGMPNGQGFEGAWNVAYLLDVLGAVNVEEITVSQIAAQSPMLFEMPNQNFRAVVMSLRL